MHAHRTKDFPLNAARRLRVAGLRVAGIALGALVVSAAAPRAAEAASPAAATSAPGTDSVQVSPAQSEAALAALVREALERNPGLQAARLDADAAHAGVKHHRAWDPPQVGIEFFDTPLASFPNPIRNQRETDYFLQQAIPFPGKRSAMAESERWRGRSRDERARALEAELARDVKSAWYELCLTDARIRSNAENRELAKRLVETARRQYEVGLGRQADILTAQAEATALRSDSLALDEARLSAEAALNVLLDRPVDGAFSATADLAPPPVPWSYGQLKALAESRHPALKALEAERSMREAELAAARREFLPDFMVKGAYKSMGGAGDGASAGAHGAPGDPGDGWSLMLGVDVPVAPWSAPRYRAGYRIAKINIERSERERRAAATRVDADVRAALARAATAWRQWELAGSALVPQAEQALQSSLGAYQTGKGGFPELLDAWRAALSARLEKQMAAARAMQGRAELERAVGMDLDSIPADAAAAAKTAPGGKS
jgi:cobalt-zinc-cadmium efflux system outer membrane protein